MAHLFSCEFGKFLRTPFLYTCSGCFYQLSDLVFHEYRLKASKQKLKCFELFQLEEKTTNFVQTMKMYCRGKSAEGTTCKILTFFIFFPCKFFDKFGFSISYSHNWLKVITGVHRHMLIMILMFLSSNFCRLKCFSTQPHSCFTFS